jgi:hypothetical protein
MSLAPFAQQRLAPRRSGVRGKRESAVDARASAIHPQAFLRRKSRGENDLQSFPQMHSASLQFMNTSLSSED